VRAMLVKLRACGSLVVAVAVLAQPLDACVKREGGPMQRGASKTYAPVRFQDVSARAKAFAIVVEFEMVPDGEGVLVSGGNSSEVYTLEVISGRAIWKYECIFLKDALISVSEPLPTGPITVRFEFGPPQPVMLGQHSRGRMFINGKAADGPTTIALEEEVREFFFCPFTFTGAIRGIHFEEIAAP